jgi:hypothetical protein
MNAVIASIFSRATFTVRYFTRRTFTIIRISESLDRTLIWSDTFLFVFEEAFITFETVGIASFKARFTRQVTRFTSISFTVREEFRRTCSCTFAVKRVEEESFHTFFTFSIFIAFITTFATRDTFSVTGAIFRGTRSFGTFIDTIAFVK